MVDHPFKGFSGLVDLLQVEPIDRAVGMGVDVAVPVAGLQRRDGVEAVVEVFDFGGGKHLFQVQVTAQVEQVIFEVGDGARHG